MTLTIILGIGILLSVGAMFLTLKAMNLITRKNWLKSDLSIKASKNRTAAAGAILFIATNLIYSLAGGGPVALILEIVVGTVVMSAIFRVMWPKAIIAFFLHGIVKDMLGFILILVVALVTSMFGITLT